MINIIKLTKQLVSIPSWVDNQNNEIKIGEFIFNFLQKYTSLTVIKEPVVDGRFNILVNIDQNTRTLVIGHIDTVTIGQNPVKPFIKGGRLYGRGTTDMKSGIAAMMLLTTNKSLPKNTGFLFYIDEEYDFAGVNKFIADYGEKIRPKCIVSLDGSELELLNGCRGLIEINGTITGQSCHAGTPEKGVNALEVTFKSVERLKTFLSQFNNPELGSTSLNLASINGGQAANVVPDNCRFVLDVRPASPLLCGQMLVEKLQEYTAEFGGKLDQFSIKFDLSSWLTPKSSLSQLKLPIKDIRSFGYADLQLLWQVCNQPLAFTIGAGAQSTAHSANEYVEIEKLKKLEKILFDVIQKI